MDVGQVWLNHVKYSYYFSFILILLLCFTFFFKYYILSRLCNVDHGHEHTQQLVHNPIVDVVSIIGIKACSANINNKKFDAVSEAPQSGDIEDRQNQNGASLYRGHKNFVLVFSLLTLHYISQILQWPSLDAFSRLKSQSIPPNWRTSLVC